MSTITISSQTNYSGTVTLSCAKSAGPTNQSGDDPTCLIPTTAFSVGQPATATVTTIAATSGALVRPEFPGRSRGLASGATVLALVFLWGIPARRPNWRLILGVVVPEIRAAWMETLPPAQRVPEIQTYLATPRGDNAETLNERQSELEQLKKAGEEPRQPCTLVSKTSMTDLPFTRIRTVRGDTSFGALDLTVNGHNVRLGIDTSYNARLPIEDVSGLLILKSAADHLRLKPIFQSQVPGIGPKGLDQGTSLTWL